MWASHFVGSPCFLTVLCREALGECCAAVDTGHSWGMWSWWCLFKAHMFSPICFPVGFYELSPVWTACAWSLIESCLACLVCFFIFDFYQWHFFFLIAEFCCIHSNTLLFKNQNVAAFFSLSFHSGLYRLDPVFIFVWTVMWGLALFLSLRFRLQLPVWNVLLPHP